MSTYTTKRRQDWDLFLYTSEYPDTDSQRDEILGFASKNGCIAEGIKRTSKSGSFECGYKCETTHFRMGDYEDTFDVCKKLCDQYECND